MPVFIFSSLFPPRLTGIRLGSLELSAAGDYNFLGTLHPKEK
jgi:hypothetical protein